MPRSSTYRLRSALGLALAVLLTVGTTGVVAAQADPLPVAPGESTARGTYIVTLSGQPAAAHWATRPEPGGRFDRTRTEVAAYEHQLLERQDRLLDRIGRPTVLYRLTTALNGFVAELTTRQVKTLRGLPGVALVERSSRQHVDAVSAAGSLGLEDRRDMWAARGGPDDAGRGVVIGLVDTGIWPENASFAALPEETPGVSAHLRGFHGACARAEQWASDDCNDKVVSARYFVSGFGAGHLAASEYLSPRDGNGHGSHTASAAAGNHDVAVTIEGQDFGDSSGMAPAARIASYKACWAAPDPADDGCDTADTVAAIDQAVADGVDVLNYSISGSQDSGDSVARALLNASAAGVFVVTSAGNGGPEAGTVGHPSPWVTTVAASTHRLFQGAVVLGDKTSYSGSMVSDQPVGPTGIVLASAAAAQGATDQDARLCRIGALDAAKTQDKIVVCDRGVIPRVDKSSAVARAGGAGMVLANTEPDSTDADLHDVPTVHVDAADATRIKAYVEGHGAGATASLDPRGSRATPTPEVADFSARGPSPAACEDVLKPDLSAPGVSIVGAVAPSSDSGRLWDIDSGTSMSAAHVAGLAAFVQGARPAWSPAEIKSAMMTTAHGVNRSAGPLAEGAGQVDPERFLSPGLVFDSGPHAWRGFLAGRTAARELNLPSVAVGELTRPVTITRRVTNVSSKTESYSANVSGLAGLDVRVQPRTLTLAPGRSRRFTVRFAARSNAPVDRYAKGRLTWTGLTHQVSIPVVVRPVTVSAPAELSGSGKSGSLVVHGTTGTGGPIALESTGLAPASPTGLSLVPGELDPRAPMSDADTFATPVEVPEDTDVARFQMKTAHHGDDVDLFVYRGNQMVASSTAGAATETVTMVEPDAGQYTVYVNAVSADNGAATTGQLFTWVVSRSGGTPVTVSPETVDPSVGTRLHYSVAWEHLDPSRRWFGAVRYAGSGRRTFLTVR